MNDVAKDAIKTMCEYICKSEKDDFIAYLKSECSELTQKDIKKLNKNKKKMLKFVYDYSDSIEHIYAQALIAQDGLKEEEKEEDEKDKVIQDIIRLWGDEIL